MNPEHKPTVKTAPLPWRTIPSRPTSVVICDANNEILFICRPELAQMIVEAVNKLEVGATS